MRYQGKVIAFNLACPHENTALRWKQANGKFECSKHNSRYTPEGKFIDGRATRNMDRLGVKRDGDNVVVDLSGHDQVGSEAVGVGGGDDQRSNAAARGGSFRRA